MNNILNSAKENIVKRLREEKQATLDGVKDDEISVLADLIVLKALPSGKS